MNRTTRISLGVAPRTLALLGALALLFALVPFAGSAEAAHTDQTSGDGLVPSIRYAGENRFDTAAKIGVEFDGDEGDDVAVETDADAVIIARGDLFPDALAGSFIAGQVNAPILLSDSGNCDACFEQTMERIAAIDPANIYIVGGEAAVPETREAQLVAAGYEVDRIAGAERIETAALVARSGDAIGELAESSTAIVARAGDFPDALVAGSIAFSENFPLLLTPTDSLAEPTAEVLADRAIEHVIIAGGTDAVSEDVAEMLAESYTVQRVSGENRQGTAAAFAEFAYENLGWEQDEISLARGDDFADALTVSPFAGLAQHAIALAANPQELGNETEEFLSNLASCTFGQLYIAGGTAAISDTVAQAARTALSQPGVACGLELSPESSTSAVNEVETVTAQVVDSAGTPVETSTAIGFEVLPAETATVMIINGETITVPVGDVSTVTPTAETVTAGANGVAEFTFTSSAAGAFQVVGRFVNADGELVESESVVRTFFEGPPDTQGPLFSSAMAQAGTHLLVLTYNETLDCDTVAADGSDYTFTITEGPGVTTPINRSATHFDATCAGNVVQLTLNASLGEFEVGHVGTVDKVDGPTVEDLSGNAQEDGDSVAFTTQ